MSSLGYEKFAYSRKGMVSSATYMDYMKQVAEYILFCDDDISFESMIIYEKLYKPIKEWYKQMLTVGPLLEFFPEKGIRSHLYLWY